MQIQTSPVQTNSITEYDSNRLVINNQKYESSVYISNDNIKQMDELPHIIKQIKFSDISKVLDCEILIIGGENINPIKISPELQISLYEKGIALEIMNLGSACRTFNILLSEGRHVGLLVVF